MNLHSLRFRLIWIHSAAITLVVVCIGLVRYQIISYRSLQQFDDALLSDSRSFVSRFRYARDSFSLSMDGLSTRDALAMQELEHHFIVTDLQGNVLREDLHNDSVRTMLRRGDLSRILRQHGGFGQAVVEDGSAYRFFSLPMRAGVFPEDAVIHIGRSMDQRKGVLKEYLVFYIYSVPMILAISVAAAWFLAARTLKPFEEITRTAEKINYENLNTQIYTKHKEEEIQRLVQSFNAMVKRLDMSFRQMRKFNADAAHELRTPLAILQTETEIALRSPNLPDEIRGVLASNLEEIDRLSRIVSDLLTLAEADAGRQVLVKESMDLKALLEDLVDQLRILASERSVSIRLDCQRQLRIDADKLWIRRAVVNLLENAIKYSRDGGTVEVSAGIEDSAVKLEIRDHGIGILPHDLPHIFDRLYRADPARSRDSGGVGLGLAIVRWIIEAHNGTIRVESEADRGALFEISLPPSAG